MAVSVLQVLSIWISCFEMKICQKSQTCLNITQIFIQGISIPSPALGIFHCLFPKKALKSMQRVSGLDLGLVLPKATWFRLRFNSVVSITQELWVDFNTKKELTVCLESSSWNNVPERQVRAMGQIPQSAWGLERRQSCGSRCLVGGF